MKMVKKWMGSDPFILIQDLSIWGTHLMICGRCGSSQIIPLQAQDPVKYAGGKK